MSHILFNSEKYQCKQGETVLDALMRQGVEIPFSCRKGSCQVCMMQCLDGDIGDEAQQGLRPVFKQNNYFLPCSCKPQADIEIGLIDRHEIFSEAIVHNKVLLSDNVCQLLIETDKINKFSAGQFINLARPEDGLARSYSIASRVDDYFIELHIKRMPGGVISNWIFDELEIGDIIELQGPNGEFVYHGENQDADILMFASSTGLAPVLGVLRDALAHNHSGNITVFHIGAKQDDIYLESTLSNLAKGHQNLKYYTAVGEGVVDKTVLPQLKQVISNPQQCYAYLAGSSDMVLALSESLAELGFDKDKCYSDVFELQDLRLTKTGSPGGEHKRQSDAKDQPLSAEVEYPDADAELWQALEGGKKLNKILDDFYTIVYQDPRLSPFFANITKQRSIEKVYLFLRQIFSGEKVYFGDRPRNAHHWMVISDELFDYREDIMMSCLRDNGLPEHLVARWRAIEESFRPDIVKDKPWNKIMDGYEIPAEGFEELLLDEGSICDSCHEAVDAGTQVRYHVRLGKIYCPRCMQNQEFNQVEKL